MQGAAWFFGMKNKEAAHHSENWVWNNNYGKNNKCLIFEQFFRSLNAKWCVYYVYDTSE